jgi:hypothetical protein
MTGTAVAAAAAAAAAAAGCSYEPKDPSVKLGMRQMLVTPGALKSGFLLVQPLTSNDK